MHTGQFGTVTSVANGMTIFEKMNFGIVKEFDIQFYILDHGWNYTDWMPSPTPCLGQKLNDASNWGRYVSQDRDKGCSSLATHLAY